MARIRAQILFFTYKSLIFSVGCTKKLQKSSFQLSEFRFSKYFLCLGPKYRHNRPGFVPRAYLKECGKNSTHKYWHIFGKLVQISMQNSQNSF